MESHLHKLLKVRARVWLKSRGCKDIREEVPFLGRSVIIDVVGYRDDEPVIGIECGTVWHNKGIYARLPFPTFQLGYLAEPKQWRNKVEPYMGRPHRLLPFSPRKPKESR